MQHDDPTPARAPREVTQSILHGDPSGLPGDCMRAAVASLLDLDPGNVPHFACGSEEAPGLWEYAMRGWAIGRGWQVTRRVTHPDTPTEQIQLPAFGLACGPSERGVSHAVVAIGGRIVWDPHPSRAGILRPKEVIEFTRARIVADEARVFEVAAEDEDGAPMHRALFTDRHLAEAYQARLPGAELDEVPIETEVPTWVVVHEIEAYVTTREGSTVTSSQLPRYLIHDQWSHTVRPPRRAWSNGDHHVVVRLTDHPEIRAVSVLAFSEAAARGGLEKEKARLTRPAEPREDEIRMDTFTAGPHKHARATHLPTGTVATAEGPGCEYVARSNLMAMLAAAPSAAGRTTLHAPADPGDDEILTEDPVPEGWILLSPRSGHTERLPVFACLGAGPYRVLLGVPALDGRQRVARLEHPHAAGDGVEACDG